MIYLFSSISWSTCKRDSDYNFSVFLSISEIIAPADDESLRWSRSCFSVNIAQVILGEIKGIAIAIIVWQKLFPSNLHEAISTRLIWC